MANFNTFNCLTEDLVLGKHVIGTHVFKVMLTNTAPVATNTVKANLTEISAGNGYTSGGPTSTLTISRTLGVTKVLASDVVITASGAIGPFRYAVLYNDTTANKPLVGWIDMGSITMANTDTQTVDFNATTGVLVIS